MLFAAQQPRELFWKARRAAFRVNQNVKRFARSAQHAVRAVYLVAEAQRASRQLRDSCADSQIVFVTRGRFISAARFGDYHKQSSLSLHVAIRKTAVVAKLTAAHFKPDEIVRVVGHAHLICFSVADFDARMRYEVVDFCLPFHDLAFKQAIVAGKRATLKRDSRHTLIDARNLALYILD